jgi:MraZ protein
MSKFQGRYDAKIDAKGRMVFPAKLKASLSETNGSQMTLFKSDDGCLELYTALEWNRIAGGVANMKPNAQLTASQVSRFKTRFFSRQIDVELDSNGRLLLPKGHVDHACIVKDVVVVGEWKKVRLWEPSKYESFISDDDFDFSEVLSEFI